MTFTVRQATLITFDPSTWTALVQVNGADSSVEMAVGRWIPAGMLAEDDQVGVLLFEETNPEHGLIVGPYGGVPAGIGARVYNSAVTSLANNTDVVLNFDSERYDHGGLHATSTNPSRLTLPVAGRYLVVGQVSFTAHATGLRRAQIRLNGATTIALIAHPAVTDGLQTHVIAATIYGFAAGDYVELLCRQASGGALNTVAGANFSPEFSAHLLP